MGPDHVFVDLGAGYNFVMEAGIFDRDGKFVLASVACLIPG